MILRLSLLVAVSLLPIGASAELAPSLAASLREPGALLVVDCGEDRPHHELARKIADDLRPLRGGERPLVVAADQLDDLRWEDAHLVFLCSEPSDPALLAVAPGLGFRTGAETDVAGMRLRGLDAGAVVSLPHPRNTNARIIALVGDGPAALRRLDRHIRSDIAASALVVDDAGERFASLQRVDGAWGVPPDHPYRADEVRQRFDTWRESRPARVTAWDLEVDVRPVGSIAVEAVLTVDPPPREGGEVWLQLTPRAESIRATGTLSRYDARDGRLLLRIVPDTDDGAVEISYTVPLHGHLQAWYLGPEGGYVLPDANWFPRIRGEVDDPYQARGEWFIDVVRERGTTVADVGDTPLLVWGSLREVAVGDGRLALLPAGAPPEMEERAGALLQWTQLHAPQLRKLVAVDRTDPWCGGDVLLAPWTLLEPGPVDELDELVLHRALTEQRVRLSERRGRSLRVRGAVSCAERAPDGVTVRLWRLRGDWWQEVDEGPLREDGTFVLSGRVRGPALVTAEAPGHAPASARLPARKHAHRLQLCLRPIENVALVCLRCGPDLRAERYPMAPVGSGQYEVVIAMDELHRTYGSFPYAFEINPGGDAPTFVLDPRRSPGQFPSYLDSREFYAETVTFQWHDAQPRFWIEVPGGLLAPEGWISASPPP